MVLKVILMIVIISMVWSLIAFVLYKIGLKLNTNKSYYWYLIPVYNTWILAKEVYFSAYLFSLFITIPILNAIISNLMLSKVFDNLDNINSETLEHTTNLMYAIEGISSLLLIILSIKLWGDIAKKLDKNFWLYGVSISLFYLPILILAFEESSIVGPSKNNILTLSSIGFPDIKLKIFEAKKVGRDTSNNIIINNKYLSLKHIEIYAQSHEIFITDLGSTNGTYIDGIKLQPHHPTKLDLGKKLILGSEDVVYQLVRRG